MRAAKERLLAADVPGTHDVARKAHDAAPGERLPLLLLQAIYDHRKDQNGAREVYKKLKALPRPPPVPEEPVVIDPAVKPDTIAYVGGGLVNVRGTPDAKGKLVVRLPINAPVLILDAQGDWLHIQKHEPEDPDPETERLMATVPSWEDGYVKASLLSSRRFDPKKAIAEAQRLEKSGDMQGALRLLTRVRVISPDDETLWAPVLRAAVATDSFGIAVEVASRISGPRGPRLAEDEAFTGQDNQEHPDCAKALSALQQVYGAPARTEDVEHGGEGFTHHVWQSSAARLTLACQGSDFNSVSVTALARQAPAKQRTISDASDPVFSPDGKRLLFSRGINLWIQDFKADGNKGKARKLAAPGTQGRWSPDGKTVLFLGYDQNGRPSGIYVIDANGKNRRRITETPNAAIPSWSADGKTVAWLQDGARWEVGLDGKGVRKVGGYQSPCPVIARIKIVKTDGGGCAVSVGKTRHPLEMDGRADGKGRWWYYRAIDEEEGTASLKRLDLKDPTRVEVVLASFGDMDAAGWDISFTLGLGARDEGAGESNILLQPLPAK